MDIKFENTLITGILNVLPEKKSRDESGIKRYQVKEKTYTSDLFIYGLNYLLQNNKLSKQDIGSIVTVSFTPDYMIPQLSFIVHAAFDLSEEVLCSDIMEENTGYIKGLLDSMLIAEHMPNKKVVLLCGNVDDKRKESNVPFYGNEGVSITIIESTENKNLCLISCSINSSHINDIRKCSGGFFDLFHEKGNQYINSTNILSSFMQNEIPIIIKNLLKKTELNISDVNFFSIPEIPGISIASIAEKLGIGMDNIISSTCGVNDSLINSLHIAEKYSGDAMNCCLIGYGAGFNYGGVLLELRQLDFCNTIHADL